MKFFASWRARMARPAKPAPAPLSPPRVLPPPLDAAEVYRRFGPRVARSVLRAQRTRAEAPKEPPSCLKTGWIPNHPPSLPRPSIHW